jgi:hypothetical protein
VIAIATDAHEPSHRAHQTTEQIAREPAAFPHTTPDLPQESAFPDWRLRLARNLSRRSDGRWEPLTRVHAMTRDEELARAARGLLRLFGLT